jgi:hypothetical protein
MVPSWSRISRAARESPVWPEILTGLLGVCLILVASTAGTALRWLGLVSGLAVAVAPWIAGRSTPVAAGTLLRGALPVAAITWWSAVIPRHQGHWRSSPEP